MRIYFDIFIFADRYSVFSIIIITILITSRAVFTWIEIIKTVGADLSARIHCIVTAVDHIHGLFSLPEDKKDSLSKFVAIMKVRITQLLREGRINPSLRVWQRGFYDHVIRDEKDFLEKAQYIENHPIKEESDTYTEWH